MAKIKITEEELKQIVNESVKRVLSENVLFNTMDAVDAAKNNWGKNKKLNFGSRVAQAVDAGNKGYQYGNVSELAYKLRCAIQKAANAGLLTSEKAEMYIEYLTELSLEVRNNVHDNK